MIHWRHPHSYSICSAYWLFLLLQFTSKVLKCEALRGDGVFGWSEAYDREWARGKFLKAGGDLTSEALSTSHSRQGLECQGQFQSCKSQSKGEEGREEGRSAQESLRGCSFARHISWYWSLTVILQFFRICGTGEICLMQCSLEQTRKNPPCHDNLWKGYYTSTLPSAKIKQRRLQAKKKRKGIIL